MLAPLNSSDNAAPKLKGGYRPDIDGLRAVAVLAVLAYHYAPDYFPGGFIGVDVFFVISGYLITGILAQSFANRTYSVLDFYQRRIRRIFPALILVLAACLGVGWFMFFPAEYERLGLHVAAGAGFIENILLWQEAGYFDEAAIQKPLLHLWSLAVEEQFYIVWPLMLGLIMRWRWPLMATITAITGLSFAVNIWGIYSHYPDATFYLPVTRGWELMVGAWLAIGHRQGTAWLDRGKNIQAWIGTGLLGLGFLLIRPGPTFPGFWALLPVLGSVLLINAGPAAFVNRHVLRWRPAVWTGLISYPLYLWHWSLLSMACIVFGVPAIGTVQRAGLAAMSFVLAWLTYLLSEQPIRRRRQPRDAIILAVVMAAVGLGGLTVYMVPGIATVRMPRVQQYLDSIAQSPRAEECFVLNTEDLPEDWRCIFGNPKADVTIAVYGDSHAMSMIPALNKYGKTHDVRIVFASLSGCLAFLDIYAYRRRSGRSCQIVARKMAALAKQRNFDAVVFIERWTFYTVGTTRPKEGTPIRTKTPGNNGNKTYIKGIPAFKHGLRTTLSYYQSLNIPVLLVEDNPQQTGLLPKNVLRFGFTEAALNATAVTLAEHLRDQRQVNEILETIAAQFPTVSVLNTNAALCGPDICPWVMNGKFLYYNDDHLSVAGAMQVYPLLEKQLNRILAQKPSASLAKSGQAKQSGK